METGIVVLKFRNSKRDKKWRNKCDERKTRRNRKRNNVKEKHERETGITVLKLKNK